MKKCLLVLLIAVLAAGCASSVTFSNSENQEEQIQKLLVGTWSGYIKDSQWLNIGHPDRILTIFNIRKEKNNWIVNAILNGRSPEYIKLEVFDNTVILEIMDNYGGLYVLKPYNNNYIVGNMSYERGRWMIGDPHGVILKKIS